MKSDEKQQQYEIAEKLLAEQDFPRAVLYGAAVTLVSAFVVGSIGGVGVGFMATGIGLIVGVTFQYIGRGIENRFAVVASIYAVVACLLGNLFAMASYAARYNGVSTQDILLNTPIPELSTWVVADLQFADLIFWMLAIGAAGYLSKRRLSRKQRLAIGMYELRR